MDWATRTSREAADRLHDSVRVLDPAGVGVRRGEVDRDGLAPPAV
jgi:hypothetical protein